MKNSSVTMFLLLVVVIVAGAVVAQDPAMLLEQSREGEPASALSSAELARLGDPFFKIVLDRAAPPADLAGIEALLAPAGGAVSEQIFVVHERIASSRPGTRRAVIAFRGTHPSGEVLTRNVMLSVMFGPNSFSEHQVEAWGWDNHRGRYNYYKLDDSGTPGQSLSWKFRGSSDGADLLAPEDRAGTCMACHVNGGPIMKELFIPWNNWQSFEFKPRYLETTAPDDLRWPIVSHPRMAALRGAEELEVAHILPAIGHFNRRRVNDVLERGDASRDVRIDQDGFARVLEGKRILKPLFVTTEVNLISARQQSGVHPFAEGPQASDVPIRIPDSFFLNASLIGKPERGGLKILEANAFDDATRIDARTYRSLVQDSGVQLNGLSGDALFAWFVPEPSHIDNDLVSRLLTDGIVSARFVAAVLAVDLRRPIFSTSRAELWAHFIPESFRYIPLPSNVDPLERDTNIKTLPADALVPQVIAALELADTPTGSPEALFLERLRSEDPVALLSEDVKRYLRELEAFKVENETAFAAALFEELLERRRAMLRDRVLSTFDETRGGLLPLPPPLPQPEGLPAEGHSRGQ